MRRLVAAALVLTGGCSTTTPAGPRADGATLPAPAPAADSSAQGPSPTVPSDARVMFDTSASPGPGPSDAPGTPAPAPVPPRLDAASPGDLMSAASDAAPDRGTPAGPDTSPAGDSSTGAQGDVPVAAPGGPAPPAGALSLVALNDIPRLMISGFLPYYRDSKYNALAINAAMYKTGIAAAEVTFPGDSGTYDVILTSLPEVDGESTYRVYVAGKPIGAFQNPRVDEARDKVELHVTFPRVAISKGDVIQVQSNPHSNGKIPEGTGFALSRGRWRRLSFAKSAL